MSDAPYRKFRCARCEDWGSVVAPDGRGTLPCPEPIHRTARTNPITGPTAGEETDTVTALDQLAALPARYTPRALQARLDQLPGGYTLPRNAFTDSDWASALWVLTAFRNDDARIWNHIGLFGMDFEAILAETGWTAAERAALMAAYSISGGVAADLDAVASLLDEELWHAVLEALRIRRAYTSGGAR